MSSDNFRMSVETYFDYTTNSYVAIILERETNGKITVFDKKFFDTQDQADAYALMVCSESSKKLHE